MVVAFILLAIVCSKAGAITRSLLPTMYQDGRVFQAAVLTAPPRASVELIGPCVTNKEAFSASVSSCAKSSEMPVEVSFR